MRLPIFSPERERALATDRRPGKMDGEGGAKAWGSDHRRGYTPSCYWPHSSTAIPSRRSPSWLATRSPSPDCRWQRTCSRATHRTRCPCTGPAVACGCNSRIEHSRSADTARSRRSNSPAPSRRSSDCPWWPRPATAPWPAGSSGSGLPQDRDDRDDDQEFNQRETTLASQPPLKPRQHEHRTLSSLLHPAYPAAYDFLRHRL